MYNWREQREKKGFLALENGEVFRGFSVGAKTDSLGEAVFNTGMTGYEEIITDPSYAGQIVVLTSPEIGNYGVNWSDMESRGLFLRGLIVREMNEPSSFRSEKSLSDILKENSIPALAGIDTRRLTLLLRSKGSMKAYLHASEADIEEEEGIRLAAGWEGLDGQDYAAKVTAGKKYVWNEEGALKVVALDFGIKYNILRSLAANDMQVTVVPGFASSEDILKMKPDGVFLSNGPADPKAAGYAIECARDLLGKVPLMGVCLGHQIMGVAFGAHCLKLRFGHHGCNHPVKNLMTDKVEITSQNHNYVLDKENLPRSLELTHINLNDGTAEGLRHKNEPAFSVQYHPEGAPGPGDSRYLFEEFKKIMGR